MNIPKSVKWLLGVVTTIVIAIVLALYYIFDPAISQLAPKCPLYLLTGYECPSCGLQRAIHCLLHGEFVAALLYNPYILVILLYALLAFIAGRMPEGRYSRFTDFMLGTPAFVLFVVITILWWVVRNTPWWHDLVGHIH